jgi:hypothetical protein
MLCWGVRRQAALQLQRQLQEAQAAASEAQAAKLKLEQELTSQQFTVQVGALLCACVLSGQTVASSNASAGGCSGKHQQMALPVAVMNLSRRTKVFLALATGASATEDRQETQVTYLYHAGPAGWCCQRP